MSVHYLIKIAKYCDSSIGALKEKLANSDEPAQKSYKGATLQPDIIQDPASYQDNLLAVALIDGATHDLFRLVDIETFIGEDRRAVVNYLSKHGGKPIKDTPEQLLNYDIYVKILHE